MLASTETLTADRPALRRSRWLWGAAALLAAMLAGLAVACGDDGTAAEAPTARPDAGPTPTELPPTESEPTDSIIGGPPPILTVATEQESMDAGLGSFCWNALCADTFASITPAESLAAMGAPELEAKLASETIAEVSVQAISTADLTSKPRNDGLLAWTGGEDQRVDLPATVDGGTVHVDISTLQPGEYVVTFLVYFEVGGSAFYSVVLEQGQ